jgi:hypothetical protein
MATAPNPETFGERSGSLSVAAARPVLEAKLNRSPGKIGMVGFGVVLVIGVIYSAFHLLRDLSTVHSGSVMPYVLLGIALLVALGFEFVNGFHDTANAVATVIYTHSLEPHIAVVWSGFWNFLGVLTSSGLVAFGIISLLPVELILQVGSKAGFAMVFALLVAAIIWNLGTWYFGFAHFDRIDYWGGDCESVVVPENGHQRRGLGSGYEYWQVAAVVADRRIFRCVSLVDLDEGGGEEPRAL